MKIITRKCELCGDEFRTTSNRAKYCPYCRDKAQALRNKTYKEKKEVGLSVTIGSEQVCPICGEKYIVKTGSQKYCENCTKKQAQSKKGKPDAQYIKEHYDYIRFNVSKEQGEEIRQYAKSLGLSVRELMLAALEEYQRTRENN